MAWDRSDKISLLAMIVASGALIVSIVVPIITLRMQYAEELAVERLPVPHNNVHVFSLVRTKDTGPGVKQIATWYEMRLTNRSNKPISVVDGFYAEGNGSRFPLDGPFFSDVHYRDASVSLRKPLELPFHLEPGESIKFHVLLPRTVSPVTGRLLIPLMRSDDRTIDTRVEVMAFAPNLFDEMEKDMRKEYGKTELGKLVKMEAFDFDNFNFTRGLLYKQPDGTPVFRDAENNARDGFIFVDGTKLHTMLTDQMLKTDDVTSAMLTPDANRYIVSFQTGSGTLYRCKFSISDMPFDRMGD